MGTQDFLMRVQLYLVAAQMAAGSLAKIKDQLKLDLDNPDPDPDSLNAMMVGLTHHYAGQLGKLFEDKSNKSPMPRLDRIPSTAELQATAPKGHQFREMIRNMTEDDVNLLRSLLGVDGPRLAPSNPPPGQRGRTPLPVKDETEEAPPSDE